MIVLPQSTLTSRIKKDDRLNVCADCGNVPHDVKLLTAQHRLQTTQHTRGGVVSTVWKTAVQIVSTLPAQAMGAQFAVFCPAGHAEPLVVCLSLLLIKSGDVESGRLIQVRQPHASKSGFSISATAKHGMKHILIRCNIIEHWVHLRCAGILLAQYTDTWTCHLHKESRLIIPSHPPIPCPGHPPTPHTPLQPKHRRIFLQD